MYANNSPEISVKWVSNVWFRGIAGDRMHERVSEVSVLIALIRARARIPTHCHIGEIGDFEHFFSLCPVLEILFLHISVVSLHLR